MIRRMEEAQTILAGTETLAGTYTFAGNIIPVEGMESLTMFAHAANVTGGAAFEVYAFYNQSSAPTDLTDAIPYRDSSGNIVEFVVGANAYPAFELPITADYIGIVAKYGGGGGATSRLSLKVAGCRVNR